MDELFVALNTTGVTCELFLGRPTRVPVGLGDCVVYRESENSRSLCRLPKSLCPDLKRGECRPVDLSFRNPTNS